MKQEKIKEIIDNYKPIEGFFDLSVKPKTLSREKYAEVLKLQNLIRECNGNIDYFRKPHNENSFERLQEYAGRLQAMIYFYWGEKIFDNNYIKEE